MLDVLCLSLLYLAYSSVVILVLASLLNLNEEDPALIAIWLLWPAFILFGICVLAENVLHSAVSIRKNSDGSN